MLLEEVLSFVSQRRGLCWHKMGQRVGDNALWELSCRSWEGGTLLVPAEESERSDANGALDKEHHSAEQVESRFDRVEGVVYGHVIVAVELQVDGGRGRNISAAKTSELVKYNVALALRHAMLCVV